MSKCPVCGMPVRVVRRASGAADHYEPVTENGDLPSQDKTAAEELRRARAGKKTVAMVGMASTSCSLAPYDDLDVEIWGTNDEHVYPWMKRATRWFQIHKRQAWQKGSNRYEPGHYEWLTQNPWGIPVYMLFRHEDIPGSVEYPLQKVIDEFFKNVRRGTQKVKYIRASLSYMIALALLEGFERIELYGYEMSEDTEYVKQKANAEFWLGMAMGRGVEIYLPENCQVLRGELYQ